MNQQTWWDDRAIPDPGHAGSGDRTIVKGASREAVATTNPFDPRTATAQPRSRTEERPGFLARTGANAAIAGMVAGLVAAVLGVGVFLAVDRSAALTRDERIVLLCVSVPILVGLLVASWAEVANGSWGAAVRRGVRAVVAGVIGSLLGLVGATVLYEQLFDKDDAFVGALVLAGGFGLIAMLAGAAIGATMSRRQALLGAIGGLVGGAVGGALISVLSAHEVPLSGHVADLPILEVAAPIPIATVLIGGSIGLISQATRRAWITIQEGPMAGREIILDKARNTVGSASNCDVVLNDPDIARKHAVIDLSGSAPKISVADRGARSQVNRRDVEQATLAPADLVLLGNTYFTVSVR